MNKCFRSLPGTILNLNTTPYQRSTTPGFVVISGVNYQYGVGSGAGAAFETLTAPSGVIFTPIQCPPVNCVGDWFRDPDNPPVGGVYRYTTEPSGGGTNCTVAKDTRDPNRFRLWNGCTGQWTPDPMSSTDGIFTAADDPPAPAGTMCRDVDTTNSMVAIGSFQGGKFAPPPDITPDVPGSNLF